VEAVRIVCNLVVALMLLATGGGKLAGAASSHAMRDSLHVSAGQWKLIGALEMLGVVGLIVGIWLPAAALAAAVGVAALMVGAVLTRLRAGEGLSAGVIADTVVLVIAVLVVLLNTAAL
jgi:uncharacterized membrane protein YphA (DoxX/SURF4 family)